MRYFLLGLFLLIGLPAAADMYLVQDIAVDEVADNARLAREKAIAKAQQKAFYQLLYRLTLTVGDLPDPTNEELLALVRDYSVSGEKTSPVRYMADVSVQFVPEAVQGFFEKNHIPYITFGAEKSLIIPLFDKDKKLLWQDENPWLAAWRATKSKSPLVPWTVPMGDLEDMAAVTEENIDEADLSSLMKRYQALHAILAHATVTSDKVTIDVSPVAKNSFFDTFSLTEEIDAPLDKVLQRAVSNVVEQLEQLWRQKNAVRFDNPSSLNVIVPIDSLADWISIRKQLDSIQMIKSYHVKAVRKDQAQVEILFVSTLHDFAEILKKEGLFLSPAKNDLWSLRTLASVPPEEVEALIIPQDEPAPTADLQPLPLETNPLTNILQTPTIVPLDVLQEPVIAPMVLSPNEIKENQNE